MEKAEEVPGAPPRKKTGKPTAAGVLNIFGGVCALFSIILVLILFAVAAAAAAARAPTMLPTEPTPEFRFLGLGGDVWSMYSYLVIIGTAFAISAGVCALVREHWGLTLAGSVIGMLFGFVGGIFCLIALILVAISKEEFAS